MGEGEGDGSTGKVGRLPRYFPWALKGEFASSRKMSRRELLQHVTFWNGVFRNYRIVFGFEFLEFGDLER